jgi:hypothetical protein
MATINVEEFYKELDATQEAYVRKKLGQGAYGAWKVPHVQHWLADRDAERAASKEAALIASAKATAFWTKVGAIGTFLAVVVAALAIWIQRAATR